MCRHRLMHRAIGNALSSSDVSDTDFGHRHVSEKTYADGGMWVGIKTMSQPIIDRKKYRQEVESLTADNRMKDMELGNGFVSKVDFVDLRRDSAKIESKLSSLFSLLLRFPHWVVLFRKLLFQQRVDIACTLDIEFRVGVGQLGVSL